MMAKLIHLWIMVFVLAFAAFTVKSSDDIQLDSVLKTEVRSATGQHPQLQDSGVDGIESMKRASLKRNLNNSVIVCAKTSTAVEGTPEGNAVGTDDAISIRVYNRDNPTSHLLPLLQSEDGFPNGKTRCGELNKDGLNQVFNIGVHIWGYDEWWPDFITIYFPSNNLCYNCPASEAPCSGCTITAIDKRIQCETEPERFCLNREEDARSRH